MRCKVKWRAKGEEQLAPEMFESFALAKLRSCELLAKYGSLVTIGIWNDDETWQIVSSTGIAAWCSESDDALKRSSEFA